MTSHTECLLRWWINGLRGWCTQVTAAVEAGFTASDADIHQLELHRDRMDEIIRMLRKRA